MSRKGNRRLSGWHIQAQKGRCRHGKPGGPCKACRDGQVNAAAFLKAQQRQIDGQLGGRIYG